MTPAEARVRSMVAASAEADARRLVTAAVREEERRLSERRRFPRGRGRRASDGAFLSQADIREMVERERPVCWHCGTPLVGPDGHHCNGSVEPLEEPSLAPRE